LYLGLTRRRRGGREMDIKESLARILAQEQKITDAFYVVFLDRCPEARLYFQATEMSRQSMKLSIALLVIECYYSSASPVAEEYLHCQGTRHHDMGVPLELYPRFRDALLLIIRLFHGLEWDGELEAQWRAAFEKATQAMSVGYRQRFHV
jgi:hemoglobin-like flavoprotein